MLIALGGIAMMGGDYLTAYFDPLPVFFAGEVVSLIGWAVFVMAIE